ncbi:MAG: hypothetical protein RLZZ324_143 [Candidatus Parcubacteria bacterium]|jgi:hypothetical protein
MNAAALARSVRATLAYFDIFDHPLTLLEVSRYLYSVVPASLGTPLSGAPLAIGTAAPSLSAILEALTTIRAEHRDGFYALPGRAAVISTRERRFRISAPKFRRARRAAALMRLLPSVRMVALCNSLALANATEESDIDLFVVARPGTLWITRLCVVGVLALLRLRPTARDSADKVCMSFFVSESRLGLQDVALKPDDTYLRYWIASLLPLYDAGGVMRAFLAANAWVGERVQGYATPRREPALHAARAWAMLGRAALPLLRTFDKPAARLQRRAFPQDILREAATGGTNVVVRDDILKFHVTDRRADFETRFLAACAAHEIAAPQTAIREKQPALQ